MDTAALPCFRVLTNAQGRYSLWPAVKEVPAGWREALAASSKEDCLEFVGRNWTQLRVRPAMSKEFEQEGTEVTERPEDAPNSSVTSVSSCSRIEFSLMFFGGDEGKAASDKYRTVIEAARYADAHGFCAVWLPERHFTFMGSLYPNPAVLHAALARETKRLRLRAGSVVLPLHDPIRVAEEWGVVDNLSGGRVEISFAPGWNAEDFVLGPDRYADRYQIMYEGIKVVERLWSGQTIERIDGQGKPFQLRTYPTPVQPKLTKWVTVAGSERSFQQAGQAGAHLLTHLFDQDVEELAAKIKLYREALVRGGYDPQAGKVAVALHTYLAGSMDAVLADAHGPYCSYLKSNVKLIEKLAQSRGIPLEMSRMEPDQLDEAVRWIFEKFFRARSLLGTPESCADLVARLAGVGVQEIACLLDFGPAPQAILGGLPFLCRLKDQFQTIP
jgi:phthiocerol/phenolphthiocerol synthesis type-I polyketide synthase D